MGKILHKRSIAHHPDCVEEYWITHTCNIKIPLERLKIEEPDGEIWYDFNEELTKEEIEQGFIYFSENSLVYSLDSFLSCHNLNAVIIFLYILEIIVT